MALSFGQERLWFLDQLSPGNPFYNDGTIVHFRGSLDVDALRRSLARIVERHEVLRTAFRPVDGAPVAQVIPTSTLAMPVVDLSTVAAIGRQAEVERRAREDVLRPLDVASGRPLRVSLLRFGEEEHVLLLTLHHIVSDAWSVTVLFRELEALYRAFSAGTKDPLPPLRLQYGDFARSQRARVDHFVADQLPYWRDKLGEDAGGVALPLDRPRPAVRSFRGSSHAVQLSPELSKAVKALGRQERVTSFTVLLTAFFVLLHQRSGSEAVRVGSAVAGRHSAETEDLIGFFINTLVLCGDLSGDPTFRELLSRVNDDVVGAMAHQDVPFEKIVEELNPRRRLSHNPLFQVWFNLVNTPPPRLHLPGVEVTIADASAATARLELALIFWETDGRFRGRFEYAEDVYLAQTIADMSRHYVGLLSAAVSQPDARLRDLTRSLAASDTRPKGVAQHSTADGTTSSSERTVLDLFQASVRRRPDAVAVACADRELTYAELDGRADRLAVELQRRGIGRDVLVAVALERSVDVLVALLATLKAGGGYVPLDPGYPPDHLRCVLEDARPSALVTSHRVRTRLPAYDGPILCVDARVGSTPGEHPHDRAVGEPRPDDLAYAIYTSGSTGRPKGVLVSHRNLHHSTSVRSRVYPDAVGRFLVVSSCSFDSSVAGIYWTLMQGGTLILPEEGGERDIRGLVDLIRRRRVTHTLMVPSLYSALIEHASAADLSSLDTVILAGETCPPAVTHEHYRRLPGTALVNEYGPTEATVWAAAYSIKTPVVEGLVPIGYPIPNTTIYLLDSDGEPVPGGRSGELYIGGPGVTRGYLGQPRLTAEKFVPDPFGSDPGERLFRSGDRARYLPNGTLEFLGRVDRQVKVRGHRIELEEIEVHLAAHPDVRQAVITDRDDGAGERRLVGYVVPRSGARLTVDAIRGFLKSRLPDYMLPASLVTLDALPLMPNGKVDLHALPDPGPARPELDREYVAPRNPLEQYLVDQWADILAVDTIGVHDSFFAIGGNSLKAAILANRLTQDLGEVLNVATLFQYSSVAELAGHLGEGHPSLLARVLHVGRHATAPPRQVQIRRLSGRDQLLQRVSELSDDEVRRELDRLLSDREHYE